MRRPRTFELPTRSGRVLRGIVHPASHEGRRPTVVVCHGFKGFMDWGFFPYLAEMLSRRGFTAVRFNFTGSGMRPGDELVTDADAFRTATFSRDLEELRELLDALGRSVAEPLVDRDRIGVFGHSRGGGVAVLASATPEWVGRLGALVTWSAVSTFDRLSDEEKARWRRDGSHPVVNTRTGQELEIDRVVLDDLEAWREQLDLEAAAARRRAPWLILHGDEDETVPVDEAERLFSSASGERRLKVLAGASHTLGARHPFDGPTPQLSQAANVTQSWFLEHLERGS